MEKDYATLTKEALMRIESNSKLITDNVVLEGILEDLYSIGDRTSLILAAYDNGPEAEELVQ